MAMMNNITLANYVRDNFDGVLVIGDVHGDFESFLKAQEYAESESFFLLSLGDLVDRGSNPYEVVSAMYKAMWNGRAGFVIGNHDNKHYRHIKGNKVSFSKDAKHTLDCVNKERMPEFQSMYSFIIEEKMFSGMYHKFDDITLVHAAGHHSLWDGTDTTKKSVISRFLVGETNGELYEDGYPVRLYNWMDEVPMGKTLIVGHDKQPIHNIPINEPMIISNSLGGKVIFLDTGCGKGGFLSGAVLVNTKKSFKLDKFMEFK